MKVFRVSTASNDYRRLDFDHRGMSHADVVGHVDALRANGVPGTTWSPPQLHFGNPLKPEPDFWCCTVPGVFAVHPRALPTIGIFIERAGKLLPVRYKNLKLTVCNILAVYDCVDPDRSEWFTMPDTGMRYAVKKPYFIPRHFEASTLFKIPTRELNIYCWESNQDPEEEFKACVEANELTGLQFELVWSDERPSRVARKRRKR
jgi:hypothetical protein